MKRSLLMLSVAATAFSFVLWSSHMATADETSDVEIKLTAPLDATNCAATPPTITVLGLSIDVSAANMDGQGGQGGAADDGGDNGGSNGTGDNNGGNTSGGCAALQVGQTVELKLSSDTPDANGNLDATEVGQGGDSEIKIEAPLQDADGNGDALDANGNVKVLGLLVNVSNASLDGLDDNGDNAPTTPPDLSTLTVGQFVKMQLASNQPPLSATQIEVKNFTNGVEVEVDDSTGTEVDDSSDDVNVEVDDTVTVTTPPPSPTPGGAGGAAAATQRVRRTKKVVHMHLSTNSGHITLSGLPVGRAKIVVTRTSNGTKGRKTVPIRGNATRFVRLRLH